VPRKVLIEQRVQGEGHEAGDFNDKAELTEARGEPLNEEMKSEEKKTPTKFNRFAFSWLVCRGASTK